MRLTVAIVFLLPNLARMLACCRKECSSMATATENMSFVQVNCLYLRVTPESATPV